MVLCCVAQYIPKPLLLEGRKCDLRLYWLVCRTSPFLMFYRNGFVRRCMVRCVCLCACLHAHAFVCVCVCVRARARLCVHACGSS